MAQLACHQGSSQSELQESVSQPAPSSIAEAAVPIFPVMSARAPWGPIAIRLSAGKLKHAPPRPVLLGEAQAEAGGDQQIVALAALHRVADEAIAGGDVPAQPFLEYRIGAEIEVEAVAPGIAEIGEEAHRLGDGSRLGHLVEQVVAEVGLGGIAIQAVQEVLQIGR